MGNIVNRVFDSSGPEGKVRGTPQQIIEKYLVLARDAQLSNDRVAYENFLQHAEHYTRMLGEAQREMGLQEGNNQNGDNSQRDRRDRDDGYGEQPQQQARGNDVIDNSDDRFGDSGLVETPEQRPMPRQDQRPQQDQRPRQEQRPQQDQRPQQQDPRPQQHQPQVERQQEARPVQSSMMPEMPTAEDTAKAAGPAEGGKPRRPRGPRKPRPKSDEATPDTQASAAE